MKYTFSIKPKYQLKSFKEGLILLLFVPIAPIFLHLTNQISFNDYPVIIYFFLGSYLLLCLPAIYLHVHYYLENNNTTLMIDTLQKQVIITNKETETFSFDEIRNVEQHLGIYYKNRHDNQSRWKASWSNYSYIKLNLKNGKSFFLSSLMIDTFNFPIKSNTTVYRFIPYLEKEEISFEQKRNWVEIERQEKIEEYLNKFSDLSTETLQKMLRDSKRYQPEAIEVVNRILSDRQSS